MTNKHYYNWQDVENSCINIALQMYKDNWRPDYIVGITRGGNVPATILSNMLNVRGEALKVSLRDATGESESNCWMASDAFGYVDEEERANTKSRWDIGKRKKILIVDDINDTGATFNWIKQDWPAGCLPNEESWKTVWHNNVRFATITDNLSSNFNGTVDYSVHEVNKAEQDVWLVYPWENVGEY
jgi:hypoxanthine phosphoribosyltransferase